MNTGEKVNDRVVDQSEMRGQQVFKIAFFLI